MLREFQKVMHRYGYTWDGMIPVTTRQAKALFAADHSVLKLYDNDTESYAESLEDILEHSARGGMFGIEMAPGVAA